MYRAILQFFCVSLFLFHLHLKDDLSFKLISAQHLTTPLIVKKSLMIFALCCGLFLLQNKIAQKMNYEKHNLYVVHHCVIALLLMFFVTTVINLDLANVEAAKPQPVILTAIISTDVLKRSMDAIVVRDLHYKFTNHADYTSSRQIKITFIIIHILYNIMLGSYHYISLGEENEQTIVHFIHFINWMATFTVINIIYYMLPNLKYDLYHIKLILFLVFYSIFIVSIFHLLFFYILQHLNTSYIIYHTFRLCVLFFIFCGHTAFPSFADWIKQRKFVKKCREENENILWSNYIIENSANYQGYLYFLVDIYCVSDLLFMIDVIQYKNGLKTVLQKYIPREEHHVDYGYLLPFRMTDSILPISPTVMDLENLIETTDSSAIHMNAEEIATLVVANFEDFIAKYTNCNTHQSILKINEILSNPMDEALQCKLLTNTTVFNEEDAIKLINDVVTLFDERLVKTNSILQLLFREYILEK